MQLKVSLAELGNPAGPLRFTGGVCVCARQNQKMAARVIEEETGLASQGGPGWRVTDRAGVLGLVKGRSRKLD